MKKHINLLTILFLLTFLIFFPYIFKLRPFLFSLDQQVQYNYFYKQWQSMLLQFFSNKTLPFYSFNTYLGNNFFASKLYYLTGDIFMPFLLLFKDISHGLMYLSFFLVVISGFNFSLFLRKFGIKRENVIILCSILYAFSGLSSMYIGQYMFHRFYAFLPLLFLGIEIYIRTNKTKFFVLIVVLLSLTSYYFLFPTCIFMVIYYFFTKYYHENEFNVFKVLNSAIYLIFSFFVGILISCVFLLPGIIYILDNERVGLFKFLLLYDIKVYLGFVLNYICAPITLFSRYGYLFNSGSNGHLTWYSIYTGSISASVICSLFISKNKTNKDKAMLITYCILLICALIPIFSSIFHGFSESSMRWMFLLTFFNCLIICINLTHFENKYIYMFKASFYYLIISLICVGLSILLNIEHLSDYKVHFLIIFISLIFFIVNVILIKKANLKFIVYISIFEVVVMMFSHLYILNYDYYYYTDTLDYKTIQYYKEIDEDKFFRIYVNHNNLLPSSDLNLNQSININFNSNSTYDSTIEPSLKKFNELNGFDWHIVDINNPEVLRMLGNKYYIVYDESELFNGYEYEYYNNVNHLKMFKLKNYRPIGFTYSSFTKDESNLKWNEELLIDDSIDISGIEKQESVNFNLIEKFNDNHLYGSIKNNNKQVLFFSIPYSKGWKVYDGDVELKTYKVQGGFIGVILEEGEHYITLKFSVVGLKQGFYASLLGIILYGIIIFFERRK